MAENARIIKLAAASLIIAIISWHVIFLALAILVFVPESQPIDWNKTWDNLEKGAGTFEHIATIIALGIGGAWAYRRFAQKRDDKPRLELSVTGSLMTHSSLRFLKVLMNVKNVGLVKVDLDRSKSGLDVYTYNLYSPSTELSSITWTIETTFAVYRRLHWLEPGESVTDQLFINLPDEEQNLLKLELVLVSKSHRAQWSGVAIVGPES